MRLQRRTLQCVPEKKETHKSSKFFWKLQWFIRKSLHCYKIQFILFLLTPVIRCIGHACMTKHEPFQMVMSKLICAEWEFKGLTGSATFQNKGTCWKRHSLAFLLSLLTCFFCLDSLFWHGLASLNLVISTQHHYSAQIDFDMHEFKLFLFIQSLRYHHVFGIKWKKRKCPW